MKSDYSKLLVSTIDSKCICLMLSFRGVYTDSTSVCWVGKEDVLVGDWPGHRIAPGVSVGVSVTRVGCLRVFHGICRTGIWTGYWTVPEFVSWEGFQRHHYLICFLYLRETLASYVFPSQSILDVLLTLSRFVLRYEFSLVCLVYSFGRLSDRNLCGVKDYQQRDRVHTKIRDTVNRIQRAPSDTRKKGLLGSWCPLLMTFIELNEGPCRSRQ